jgi:hypothetical protein
LSIRRAKKKKFSPEERRKGANLGHFPFIHSTLYSSSILMNPPASSAPVPPPPVIIMLEERALRANPILLAIGVFLTLIEYTFVLSALLSDRGITNKFASLTCNQPLFLWLAVLLVGNTIQLLLCALAFRLARSNDPLGWMWNSTSRALRVWAICQMFMVLYAQFWLLGDTTCALMKPNAYQAVRITVWVFYLSTYIGIVLAFTMIVCAELARHRQKQE